MKAAAIGIAMSLPALIGLAACSPTAPAPNLAPVDPGVSALSATSGTASAAAPSASAAVPNLAPIGPGVEALVPAASAASAPAAAAATSQAL